MKKIITLAALLVIIFNQVIIAGNGNPKSGNSSEFDIVTYTQGKWGGQKNDELDMIFKRYFANGLKIGTINSMVLTSAQAVEEFLPSGTSAKPFPFGQMTDPGLTYRNALAGELVSLSLNLALDHYRKDGATTLLNMEISSGELQGVTVEKLYQEANRKLGGEYSKYSFNILTEALYAVNKNFTESKEHKDFLRYVADEETELANRKY